MGSSLTSAQNAWLALDRTKRLALVVLVVAIAGTISLWTYLGSQVPYEVAFGNVKAADAAPIVAKLKDLQIPYELNTAPDGTTTIRVPSYLADEARVQIAGAGLLQGNSVGYEIFNQPSFGISDFIQKVDYQRALEGELARSITQVDSVDSARVHLAIPQPSLFVSQQQDPSAAVIIGLKSGKTMDRAQANAIVNLVAGAVAGMKPSGVVLLDTQGHLLHSTDTTASAADPGSVGDQYATQRAMETDLQNRLQDMLDRVVGPGKSTAQVTLNLDWTSGDVTSETYLPNGTQPAIQSDQEVHDVSPAGASGAGGVPGVTSNVPVYQSATTPTTPTPGATGTPSPGATPTSAVPTPTVASGTATSEHVESNKTYQVSRTVEKTQKSPGVVTRLSVAIVVDSGSVSNGETAQLTQMVEAAVGYDAKRGDSVSVVAVPMKADATTPAANPADLQTAQKMEYVRLAALAAGPLLAILVLAFLLLRRRPKPTPRIASVEALPTPGVSFLPALADPARLPLAMDDRRAYIREQVNQLAEKHPSVVAAVLQAWMNEERENRS